MTVCGGSGPSPQAFRQASPLSPLQLLATSPTPFTHTNTRDATGSLPLDHNKQHCEFTHVVSPGSSLTHRMSELLCALGCIPAHACSVSSLCGGLVVAGKYKALKKRKSQRKLLKS